LKNKTFMTKKCMMKALFGAIALALDHGGAGQLLAGIGTLLAFTNAPHRFIISQQLGKAEKLEPLQPRGIYRYVRDPFLLTGLVQMWLMPFMTIRLLVLLILSSIYLCLGSLHWEMRLGAQFGKEYEDYRKKVPRIIPGVLNRT
jgi:protein-S-isoprenylcysteine O-methyltransferase Ste14